MHDILLGKMADGSYIRLGGGSHVALYAPTESGKGVGFVLPNCFAWTGSLIVLDVKGEVFEATAGHRAAMGQQIYRFDPAAEDGRSHRWNPFTATNRLAVSRFRQIGQHANMLFPHITTVGSGSTNPFWQDAGRQAFGAVAMTLAETPDEDLTMEAISHLFMRLDGHEVLTAKLARWRQAGHQYSEKAVFGLSDYIGDDPKLRGDIRKTVSTQLNIWMDPQISAATSASDFDLADIRRKPMTIYVTVQPGDIPRLMPLLRLFFDQVIQVNTRAMPRHDPSLNVPVLMMMDEVARLGRMDTIAQAPQYVRDYGIRMALVGQSKAQFRAIYGDNETDDIFSNVGAEILFGSADAKLSEEIERRMGDNTVTVTTRNRPRFMSWLNWSKQGESDHPHRRPLMLDQELMQLPLDEQIIIRPGMPPMRTKRIRWYDDPHFRPLVKKPPLIPKLNVSVAMHQPAREIVGQA
jgi:type IV secretion system protein VirD4